MSMLSHALFSRPVALVRLVVIVTLGALLADIRPAHTGTRDLARIDLDVAAELQRVKLAPTPGDRTIDHVRRFKALILARDFDGASAIIRHALTTSQMGAWRFDPFQAFMDTLDDSIDSDLEQPLKQWGERDAKDPLPVLVRSLYHCAIGWQARGTGFIRQTQRSQLIQFEAELRAGLELVNHAISLDGTNPYAFHLRLRILAGRGTSVELAAAFEDAIKRHPSYYPHYTIVLSHLTPKWGGSIDALYGFVDQYAGQVDQASPLKMLYLRLFGHLLWSASGRCDIHKSSTDMFNQCVNRTMDGLIRPSLMPGIQAAVDLHGATDRSSHGIMLNDMLYDILDTEGGVKHGAILLDSIAARLGSSITMSPVQRVEPNYVIDMNAALLWHRRGHYEHALHKARQALRNAENTEFSNASVRRSAISRIYHLFARIHGRNDDYYEIIFYRKLHALLGGPNQNETPICYAYYKLRDYASAVKECDRLIASEKNYLAAHYWRGLALVKMGNEESAFRDLAIVAGTPNEHRSYAANHIAYVQLGHERVEPALDTLARYPFLFDPRQSTKSAVAVAYNNRCYALMKLERWVEALRDCEESLKYDDIPDAHAKRTELLKRLTNKP